MRTSELDITGVAGRVTLDVGVWRGIAVLVSGAQIPRQGRNVFALPGVDGTPRAARLQRKFFEAYPRIVVDGVVYPTGPATPKVLAVLVCLPFLLVGVGGLIGGLLGATAVALNAAIARTSLRAAIKVSGVLVVGGVATGIYIAIALAVQTVIPSTGSAQQARPQSLVVGTCVVGLAQMNLGGTAPPLDLVDCAVAHDGEMFATFDLPAGVYPGDKQVAQQAQQGCLDRFQTYVGVSPEQSSLAVPYTNPKASTWDTSRTVDCFLSQPDLSTTTGTLKGSRR